jgi:hypothetical protein
MKPATPANAVALSFQWVRRLQPGASLAGVACLARKALPSMALEGCEDKVSGRLQRSPIRGRRRRRLAGVRNWRARPTAIVQPCLSVELAA